MNFLWALLAFAGIMAFLSTLVSVFVEGLHKAFALRRSGLEEMLRSLHSEVLVRLDPTTAVGVESAQVLPAAEQREAVRFARTMTTNVAFAGRGRFWWLRNLPILSWLFQRRHERLSTLQFIEQLSRSDIGGALRGLGRTQRQRALVAAAYEFERFGDAQSSYFQSRARIISVLLSVVFAVAVNVDALALFRQLATDEKVRQTVLSEINTNEINRLEQQMAAAQALGDEPQVAQLRMQISDAAAQVETLGSWGLRIGYTSFPFCYRTEATPSTQADPRCRGQTSAAISAPQAFARAAGSGDGWLWLLSVIAAGGMIGLGAPFWFQVFRRLSRIAPGADSVRAALSPDQPASAAPQPRREAARDPRAAHPDALLLAFDVASGNVADSIADPSIHTALDAGRGPLVVRGDGSVVDAPARRLR